jgi:hypothetical protein
MTNPVARGPGQLRIDSTVTVNRAVEGQAKVTGGASNYSLQSAMQSTRNVEERRKAASDLISVKNVNAAQAALPTMRNPKRSDEEDEGEDEHGNPRGRRRNKRKPPIPTPAF